MKQGSEEWLKARTGFITGSRIGAILGKSPWQSPQGVLREMVRQYHNAESEFIGNIATEWGSVNEAKALSQYEVETGSIVQDHGLIRHPIQDILAYSPDGSVGQCLLEIKCPYSQKVPAELPSHYWHQVQLGMEVMSLDSCDFVYWTPGSFHIRTVRKEHGYLDKYLPALKAFHALYLAELDNPEHLEPKVQAMTSIEWAEACEAYQDLKHKIDRLKKEEADAKKKLIKLAQNKSAKGNGLTLTRVERVGAVDYSNIPALNGVNLEDYRKKGSVSFRITEEKAA